VNTFEEFEQCKNLNSLDFWLNIFVSLMIAFLHFETGAIYEAQDVLELPILLPQLAEY
jgi:hypothetical protein